MATIYPTSVTYNIPAGGTINGSTFASNGTYVVTNTYTGDSAGSVPTVTGTFPRAAISWGNPTHPNESKETSLNADRIIESLFRLNPEAEKKYEGDKAKFAAALIAAGEAAYQKASLTDLRALNIANDL